jgi:hypothetical protein
MAQPGDTTTQAVQWAIWVAQAVAVLLGLGYGYAFGAQVSGPVLGVVVAINAAVFGALCITAVVDLADRLRSAVRQPGRPPG